MADITFLLLIIVFLSWFFSIGKSPLRGEFLVNFKYFFCFSSVLYLLIPSLLVYIDGEGEQDFIFLFDVLLFYTSIFVGFLCYKFIFTNIENRFSFSKNIVKDSFYPRRFSLINTYVLITTIICGFLVFYFINTVYGSFSKFFFQRYGSFNEEGISSITSMIPFILNGYILFFNSKLIRRCSFSNSIVIIFSFFCIILFILGGNRNLGVMFCFSFILARWNSKIFNLSYVLAVMFFGILSAAIIAVFREYGLLSVLTGESIVPLDDLTRYIFAYNEGEFGTAYRVSQYYNQVNFTTFYPSGFSYFISPVINMIPSSFFPERPTTIAVDFTNFYWSKFISTSDFIEGLGFSPIVEAKANFGYYFPLFFILLTLVVYFFGSIIREQSYTISFLISSSFSSTLFNFFRIDFSLYIKFSLMTLFFSILFLLITRIRSR